MEANTLARGEESTVQGNPSNQSDVSFSRVVITFDRLRRRLEIAIDELKEIRDQGIRAVNTPTDVPLFKGMLRSIDQCKQHADKLWNEMCDLDTEQGVASLITEDDRMLKRKSLRYFHEANSMAESLASTARVSMPGQTAVNYSTINAPRNSLPSIPIPKFNGDRIQWRRFRDIFNSLVNNDVTLSDADRYHYLIGALEGPAASTISRLSPTAANYPIAWQTLMDTYDNSRLLAAAYLDQLIELKPLTGKPTTEALRLIVSQISESVAAFNTFTVPDKADFLLFHLTRRCLDPHTREAFELAQKGTTFPTFDSLIEFVRKRCDASELAFGVKLHEPINSIPKANPQSTKSRPPWRPSQSKSQVHSLAVSSPNSSASSAPVSSSHKFSSKQASPCHVCRESHPLYECDKFKGMSVQERQETLKGWKGCLNCLSSEHSAKRCQSRWRCRSCRQRHHTLLHREREPAVSTAVAVNFHDTASQEGKQFPRTGMTSMGTNRVVLGTAIGYIQNKFTVEPLRLVLDSASHKSFITQKCADRCNLRVTPSDIEVRGIADMPMKGFRGRASCTLWTDSKGTCQFRLDVIVVDKIMAPQPVFEMDPGIRQFYQTYNLADPGFWKPSHIDFLLGCDAFSEVLTGEVITVQPHIPRLIGTYFGQVVLGRFSDLFEVQQNAAVMCSSSSPSIDNKLHEELRRFWSLEEPPAVIHVSAEDKWCENYFRSTTFRLPSGRYVVKLPFREVPPASSSTRGAAMRRLLHLESKLSRDAALRELYCNFMHEYISLGHMEYATQPGTVLIPHHGIFKGNKIRVVFDASAKSTALRSLNERLHQGPKLQADLASILLNFRLYKVAFTTDIVKMYRQILVHPDDRRYQHVLWRFSPDQPVDEYELRTLTYGMSCAPYLALRVIKQLVEDEGTRFPLAAQILHQDIYVDDIATGAQSLEEAREVQRQLIDLLAKGALPLSKWASNYIELMDLNPKECSERHASSKVSLDLEEGSHTKILGLQWDHAADMLTYEIKPLSSNLTKRGMLSVVAKLFDPLGLLGPSILLAKLLIQKAWRLELGWDDPLPTSLQEEWTLFVDNLPSLREVSIPRYIYSPEARSTSLLIFCDASEVAYASCAYLKTETQREVFSHLILCRTKLAPIKGMTIPRLELCAAVLGAKVLSALKEFRARLKPPPSIYMFSDAMTVLRWIHNEYDRLPAFVCNRVALIRELTAGATWRHVPSGDNPSDLGSRGLDPPLLKDSSFWFRGPDWIHHSPDRWPESEEWAPIPMGNQPGVVTSLAVTDTTTGSQPKIPGIKEWMERFSSLDTLVRSMAYVLRFISNTSSDKSSKRQGLFSSSEILHARWTCYRLVQADFFFEGKLPHTNLKPSKDLLPLSPFINERGVLMVGGRLRHAHLPINQRHPILLPAKSHLAQLILHHYHQSLLHPGPSILIAAVRTKYWITGLRNAARQLSRNCVVCRQMNAAPCRPRMGDLPTCRFREGRAFANVGVDFGGPFLLRDSLRRKAANSKAYICLFVCLSTKALHLEVVSSLTTQAFIAAFERLVGRRGLPYEVYSDNGTNFKGTARYLQDIYHWHASRDVQDHLKAFAAQREFRWNFIPPHAPHFGGIWEAGIKATKRLLLSVYGDGLMTYEEFNTLLIKVESILNSRPLCPLSSDPNDLEFLTPAHFLIGQSFQAPPEYSFVDENTSLLQRWQVISQMSQHFWVRWRTEYLATLQQRSKWNRPQKNLVEGDLVFFKDERVPRLQWPRGRIEAIHPGKDGVVRVVSVRTKDGIYKRPVHSLVPLFNPDSRSDNTVEKIN